jgi:TolB-like protein
MMRAMSSAASLVCLLAVSLFAVWPAAAAPAPRDEAPGPSVDEGAVIDAVEEVLSHGRDAVRLAVPPLDDEDQVRRAAVEIALVRAVRDRRREEIVTPAFLRARLRARSEAAARALSVEELRPFSADHVLLGRVLEQGGEAVLRLKLLHVESGEVLAEASATLGAGAQTTASAGSVRLATESLVEQIAYAVESAGDDVRQHRVAVSALRAEGAAAASRLDRFLQAELLRGLRRRGFLVVERAELDAATDQLALGQVLEEGGAPQIGKMLGAQSLVVGAVAEAGASFLVSLRVVSAVDGAVLGGARAALPRDDVVSLAAVETRTSLEAALRSVIAPGWGQAYNGQGAKAVAFGVGAYGGLLATAGLGAGGLLAQARYNDVSFFEKLPAEERGAAVLEARQTADALYIATAVMGGVTATVWALGVVDAFLDGPQP